VFLQAAFAFLGGTCGRCTIDNTSVLVAAGSGPGALIAAPMEQFGQRFGVPFVPHAIGHADRKGWAAYCTSYGGWVDVSSGCR